MLTLICGVPNAGKTTFSQQFDNVIHADDIQPKGKSSLKVIIDMIAGQGDVCVEGAYLVAQQRRALAAAYDGEKRCIWLDVPLEVCIARENRGRRNSLHKLCHEAMQLPTKDEGWDDVVKVYNL